MNKKIFSQLSIMMFLEFFVWGAWYVTVGNFMSAIGMSKYVFWAFTVGPIAAIVSPFFLGMIADRFFPTQKVLAIAHILGGIFIFLAPSFTGSVFLFVLFLLLHMLCYQPTVSLANTLAFSHMENQEKQFPFIRAFGTVGWIVAGILVSKILQADMTATPLKVSGIAAVALGLFSFTLPNTPPPAKGKKTSFREIVGIDAIKQLGSNRSFNVYILSSMLICIPLAAYYSYAQVFVANAGFSNPGFSLSFGQMGEAFLILLLPLFFKYAGVKKTLFVGMLAWVVRYAAFALGAPNGVAWMIYLGIILHGICYDFFFVTGQIYVDKVASPEIRGQAQGFNLLFTYGVGMLIGAQVTGYLFNNIVSGEGAALMASWKTFWWYPCIMAAVIMIFFLLFFKEKKAAA